MFSIYAGSDLLYSNIYPKMERKVMSPTLKMEVDSAGSLNFTVSKLNSAYVSLQRMKTIVTVKKNNEEIWTGRVINDDIDFNNNRKIYCEGSLAFLNDSCQLLAEYKDLSFGELVTKLLDIHNNIVGEERAIYYGGVSGDLIIPSIEYWGTVYENTLETIVSLCDKYRAHYIVKRVFDDSKNKYINKIFFFKEILNKSDQYAVFGKNLMDFTQSYDLSKLVTVLIPLAETDSDEDEPLSAGQDIDIHTPSDYDENKKYGVIVPKQEYMEIGTIDKKMNQIEVSRSNLSRTFTQGTPEVITPTWGDLYYSDWSTTMDTIQYYAISTTNGPFRVGYRYKIACPSSQCFLYSIILVGDEPKYDYYISVKREGQGIHQQQTCYSVFYIDILPRYQNGSDLSNIPVDIRLSLIGVSDPSACTITKEGPLSYTDTHIFKAAVYPYSQPIYHGSTELPITDTRENPSPVAYDAYTVSNFNKEERVNLNLIRYTNSDNDTVTEPLTYLKRSEFLNTDYQGDFEYTPADYVKTYFGLASNPWMAISSIGNPNQFQSNPWTFPKNESITGTELNIVDGKNRTYEAMLRQLSTLDNGALKHTFSHGVYWDHMGTTVLELSRDIKSIYVSGRIYADTTLFSIWRIKPDTEVDEDLWISYTPPGYSEEGVIACSYGTFKNLNNDNTYIDPEFNTMGKPLARFVIDDSNGTPMMLNPNKIEFIRHERSNVEEGTTAYYKHYKIDIPDDKQCDRFFIAISGGIDLKVSISSNENSEIVVAKDGSDGIDISKRDPWDTAHYENVYNSDKDYGVFVALTEQTALTTESDLNLYAKNNSDPDKLKVGAWTVQTPDDSNRTFVRVYDEHRTDPGKSGGYDAVWDMSHYTDDNDYRTCALLVRASYQDPNTGRKYPHSIWISSEMKNLNAFYMIFDYCRGTDSTYTRYENAEWPENVKFYFRSAEYGKYVGNISRIEQKKITMPFSTNPNKLMLVLVSAYGTDPKIWVRDPEVYQKQKYITIKSVNLDGSVYLMGGSLNKFNSSMIYGNLDPQTGEYVSNPLTSPYASIVTEDYVEANADGVYRFSTEYENMPCAIIVYRYSENGDFLGLYNSEPHNISKGSPFDIFTVEAGQKFKMVLINPSPGNIYLNAAKNLMFYRLDSRATLVSSDFVNGVLDLNSKYHPVSDDDADPWHNINEWGIGTDTTDTNPNYNYRITTSGYFDYENKVLAVDVFLDTDSPKLKSNYGYGTSDIFEVNVDVVGNQMYNHTIGTETKCIYGRGYDIGFLTAPVKITDLPSSGRAKLSIEIYRTVVNQDGNTVEDRRRLAITPEVINKVMISDFDRIVSQKSYTPPNNSYETYGRIERRVIFEAETSQELYDKAVEYMNASQFDEMTLKASAIELTILGEDVGNLNPGDSINVSSPPHGMDKDFPISSLSMPLDKADASKFELGYKKTDTLNNILKGESKW